MREDIFILIAFSILVWGMARLPKCENENMTCEKCRYFNFYKNSTQDGECSKIDGKPEVSKNFGCSDFKMNINPKDKNNEKY